MVGKQEPNAAQPASVLTHLVQMEVLPGRPAENTARILGAIATTRRKGAALVAFPELAIPGYLIGDEWEREAFLRECEACGERVRAASAGITVVFGNVAMDWTRRNEDGRVRKYNALFVARDGRFQRPLDGVYDFTIKTLLPNYREFDDSRHFFDLRKLAFEEGRTVADLLRPIPVGGLRLGGVLCEDAWDLDYAVSPLRVLAEQGVDLFVNISCSPFTVNKNHKRNRVFSRLATELGRPLLYVNSVGLQDNGKTVFTFDGASCVYDGHGHQCAGPAPFTEGVLELEVPLRGAFGAPLELRDDDIGAIYAALRYGTAKFMARCGIERVVVGVSGGIDSAVVAALYRDILPPDRLLLVNMPSRYNSPRTRTLAQQVAANLGALYAELPIEESVRLTAAQLDGLEVATADGRLRRTLKLTETALENVQARDRSGRVLAAAAAAFGGVFTCNANKSEATVGYTTLYGDLGGYLANLADLWKGEVYALARHLNAAVYRRVVIPQGCLDVIPSAELSPAQDIEQGRGDPLNYPYHDCLFRSWVEWWNRATPEDILEWYLAGTLETQIGFAGNLADAFPTPAAFIADLERWWSHYQGLGVAKRIQAPPILAVKRRAFGFDHREAQIGARYTRRYEELKRAALEAAGDSPQAER
jgi:NAD+ synthase (glutamine-hydrolysing)